MEQITSSCKKRRVLWLLLIAVLTMGAFVPILKVERGGTGRGSLTSGNVILGAGSSPVNFVAPGTSGNVLTSNGSTWTSSAPVTFDAADVYVLATSGGDYDDFSTA